MKTVNNDEEHIRWMKRALAEAETALGLGEAPVGAVIVREGVIIGRGGNRVETLRDPTAHAEILAIGAAAEATGYERLIDTIMYVTLEPCPMCAGAIVLARIPMLVYGASDPKMGACGSIYDICGDGALNHRVETISGVMEQECSGILREFFRSLRKNNK
ncbi:tRNA adenosine(34) deaminase TadA [bacterium]|nr:tRNA adenosine(34) deaminase TadA [bacterium]